MAKRTGDGVVHSYDVGRRLVRCGSPTQASSTKHAAGVTCRACRELLGRAQEGDPTAAAPAGHGE